MREADMKPPFNLSIGALSAQAAVNIETIRYYERIGLMPKPPRSAGRHRLYSNEHKRRLVFIRRARELGFSVKQVRVLLGLANGRRPVCGKVRSITEQHIAEIRYRVKALERLEGVLKRVTAQCRGDESTDCAILEALADQNDDICGTNAGDIVGRAR
jgi:MerR family transcriptional regulator, mercuric resistance operon regulatory protein